MRNVALYIHAGLPKTATTSIQMLLAGKSKALEEANLLYPDVWRDAENIAHHKIGATLNDLTSSAWEDLTGEIIDLMKRNFDKSVIISTESLTNAIRKRTFGRLQTMLGAFSAERPVHFVLCLRRIDEFFESMYLHATKVGEDVVSIEEYLRQREHWAENFFLSLFMIKELNLVTSLKLIPYKKNSDIVSEILRALHVPGKITSMLPKKRANSKLGLKAQTVLLHLPEIERRLGVKISRFHLIYDFENGALSFDNDIYNYRIMPWVFSRITHENALRSALYYHCSVYYEAFNGARIEPYSHHLLDINILNDADIAQIALHLELALLHKSDQSAVSPDDSSV